MTMSTKHWSFSAQIERFEGEGEVHFLAIPNDLIDDIKSEGKNGMSSPSTMRCRGIAGSWVRATVGGL